MAKLRYAPDVILDVLALPHSITRAHSEWPQDFRSTSHSSMSFQGKSDKQAPAAGHWGCHLREFQDIERVLDLPVLTGVQLD